MTVVWHHEHRLHERHVAPNRLAIFWWIIGTIFILSGVIGGGWFFWKGWKSGSFPVVLERILFVPIGYEDGNLLWFPNITRLARGIAASDNRTAVTEADYLQAIDATVRRNALESIAVSENVAVNQIDVAAAVQWTDDIRAFESLAGWNDAEYLAFIERSFVLSNAVENAILNDESHQAEAHARMKDIQAKLELGIAFDDVAKEYSEDPSTAQTKGSFGYVLPAEVDPAFAPVFALPSNTVSDVIATQDAYWILRTEDSVVDESGTRVLLRGIAVKKQLLANVLDAKASAITPLLWVR